MNLALILNAIRQLLGFTHRGVKTVEKVVSEFDQILTTLETAVGTIDKTTAVNEAFIAAKIAENAALDVKREQALVLRSNLGVLVGK